MVSLLTPNEVDNVGRRSAVSLADSRAKRVERFFKTAGGMAAALVAMNDTNTASRRSGPATARSSARSSAAT
jgi:hypothetical protein